MTRDRRSQACGNGACVSRCRSVVRCSTARRLITRVARPSHRSTPTPRSRNGSSVGITQSSLRTARDGLRGDILLPPPFLRLRRPLPRAPILPDFVTAPCVSLLLYFLCFFYPLVAHASHKESHGLTGLAWVPYRLGRIRVSFK